MFKSRFSKFATLILLLMSVVTNTVCGQVTIGSNDAPITGALLQIKDNDTVHTNGETATKGFGLPRVKLTSLVNLFPMFTDDGAGGYKIGTTSYDKSAEDEAHAGLVIYNVSVDTCRALNKGLHIWDGAKWQFLGNTMKDVRTVTDNGKQITMSYLDETTTYRYSSFGAAGTWMTENMATRYLPDGSLISAQVGINNSYTDPQYLAPNSFAYNDSVINITKKVGLLYNWPAAMANYRVCYSKVAQEQVAGSTPGPKEVESVAPDKHYQGICPTGWHLPSDREWNELEKAITEDANTYSISTYTPAEMVWDSSWDTSIKMLPNTAAFVMRSATMLTKYTVPGTSKSAKDGGFDVLPVGYGSSGFAFYGTRVFLWSSSTSSIGSDEINKFAWKRDQDQVVKSTGSSLTLQKSYSYTYSMNSVRCKKD